MSQETRKGGLGRGLAALIPSAPSSTPRLGDSAADIVLGGTRGARSDKERRDTEEAERAKVAKAFRGADKITAEPETEQTEKPAAEPARESSSAPAREPSVAPAQEPDAGQMPDTGPTSRRKPVVPRDATGAKVPPLIAQAAAENDARRRGGGQEENPDPVVAQSASEIGASYREIPVGDISPNPRQPRQVFEEESLDELVHSIREFGLMQPIVVRPAVGGTGYELIMGERRWRASRRAGLDTIPAIVRETEDGSMLRDALLENIHRVQLNPLEEAAAYQQLLEEFDVTQAELADRLGRSRPVITNMIRLLALPVTVQRKVAAGVLTAGHARALLGLKAGEEDQAELAQRITAEGLSVRATEEAVTLLNRGDEEAVRKKPAKTPPPEYLTQAADRLADGLDTKVNVSMGKRKGKIVVEFGDREDFERIMALISREEAGN